MLGKIWQGWTITGTPHVSTDRKDTEQFSPNCGPHGRWLTKPFFSTSCGRNIFIVFVRLKNVKCLLKMDIILHQNLYYYSIYKDILELHIFIN
jgi:hypothetical protein